MTKSTLNSGLLAVSAPPFWHCGRTIRSINITTLIAMLPIACMAIWHWGIPAARVMALSIATAVLVEWFCQKIMECDITIDNFAAFNTGLLFAFLMPADSPWWIIVLGAGLSITLGKMAFGGLGANPVNSALVGWALLYVSWPVYMDPNAMQLSSLFVDPLVQLKFFGVSDIANLPWLDLFLGKQIGGLGATQGVAIVIGGAFLLIRGMLRWEIVVSFLIGLIGCAAIFHGIDSNLYASPVFHLLTGSSLLGAFYLSTEVGTAPHRQVPMMIYGLLGGVLVVIIRVYGVHVDGVAFAILLINLLTPLLNAIRPKPFGGK